MSLAEWNLGLDDSAAGNLSKSGRSDAYYDGYDYGESIGRDLGPPEPEPPTQDEDCADRNHPYYGDQKLPGQFSPIGRCYCGARAHPNAFQQGIHDP